LAAENIYIISRYGQPTEIKQFMVEKSDYLKCPLHLWMICSNVTWSTIPLVRHLGVFVMLIIFVISYISSCIA